MAIISLLTSGIGGTGGTPTPTAPNITSATATPVYGLLGNDSSFGFSGIITLPTGSGVYTNLSTIELIAIDSTGQETYLATYSHAVFSGASLAYSTPTSVFQSYTGTLTYAVKFLCRDLAGVPTPSPYTVSGITIQRSYVTSVTATDSGTRMVDDGTRLPNGLVNVVVALNGNQVPQMVNLWCPLATDASQYECLGPFKIETVGQTVQVRRLIASPLTHGGAD